MVDRPGKNISIILTNHGYFGLFSTSLKFERGRPRWILSDSRSTWKIQIVSKMMQIASNVSMRGGADRYTVKLQGTACVMTLTYPLFLSCEAIRQKHNKPLAVDARCLLRAIDAVAARKTLKQAWIFSASHTITPPGSCIHRKAINKDKPSLSSGVLPSRQQYHIGDYPGTPPSSVYQLTHGTALQATERLVRHLSYEER